MANGAKKTEHAGSKRGRGAYYGLRKYAKSESNRERREQAKRACKTES